MASPTHVRSAVPSSPRRACRRPVDLVHLARHTFGDPELERQVLQLFVLQSDTCLKRLKDARDDAQWRSAAHAIKGSALGVGAWDVARSAEALEEMGPETGRPASLESFEGEIDEAAAFIRGLFTEH